MKMEKDARLEEQKQTFFWVFGVWDDWLNEDMTERLEQVINKIYEDGFTDWLNEKDE